MNHNDVDRRTAREMPARTLTSHTLTPRRLRAGGDVLPDEPWLRPMLRALPPRRLHRICEGGR